MEQYLQAVSLALGAIYNSVIAFDNRGRLWKCIGSAATAIFLAVSAYLRIRG